MMQVQLEQLLSVLFPSPDELRRFLRSHALTRGVVDELPGPSSSKAALVYAAVTHLEARGLVPALLQLLADDALFRMRRPEIFQVMQQWSQAQESLRDSPIVSQQIVNHGAVGQQFNIAGNATFHVSEPQRRGQSNLEPPRRAPHQRSGTVSALLAELIAQALRYSEEIEPLRPALERLRMDCRVALARPQFSDLPRGSLHGIWTLATLDLSRLAASQLRYAESRHHLHEALREAQSLSAEERERLARALHITLTDILESPPPEDIDPWTWAQENVPPP